VIPKRLSATRTLALPLRLNGKPGLKAGEVSERRRHAGHEDHIIPRGESPLLAIQFTG